MVKFVDSNLLLKTISLSHENLARDLNKKKRELMGWHNSAGFYEV
jgi:hypothetical protein